LSLISSRERGEEKRRTHLVTRFRRWLECRSGFDVAAVVVEYGLELMSLVEFLRVFERSHTVFDSLKVRFGVTELLGFRVLGFSQFFCCCGPLLANGVGLLLLWCVDGRGW
jgi:hypothetical protein